MAAMRVVALVLTESPSLPNHEPRIKFVAHFMREPDFGARRLSRFVAANLPNVQADAQGRVFTTATDMDIYNFILSNWTALGQSLGQFP